MRRRGLSAVALLALVGAVTTGCGPAAEKGATPSTSPTSAATSSPSAPPSATPTENPAARLLAALQASAADLGAVRVSGGTGAARLGHRTGTSDLTTGDFVASTDLGSGVVLKMIRQADLTWTMAPSAFWVSQGYTRATAREASGKWVVAPAAGVKPLIDTMDPGAIFRSLKNLGPRDVSGLSVATRGDLAGKRVLTFRQLGGAVQRVYLTDGEHPRPLRVTSTNARATTTIDFVAYPKTFHVRLPRPSEVLQAR
ncbi:MAG: hypothetical protein ACJ72D_23815 [Marmoricola sp.]